MRGDLAQVTAERLLQMIGWRFSKKQNKRLPMSRSFSALGVVFDFGETNNSIVKVRNKPERVSQLVADIQMILDSGCFSPSVATSLRGRLQFAESQTYGRAVALRMRSCHLRATQNSPGTDVTPANRAELHWALDFVLCAYE